jgi:hypothetical protein
MATVARRQTLIGVTVAGQTVIRMAAARDRDDHGEIWLLHFVFSLLLKIARVFAFSSMVGLFCFGLMSVRLVFAAQLVHH